MSILTASACEGFVTEYLLPRYDRASAIKEFHRDWWKMACLPDQYVALAAPRGHSKSTSFNLGYSLAAALIRSDPYQLKISRTRPIAVEFLRSVKTELMDNEKLIDKFGILPAKEWPRDTEDDFICRCEDGYEFRMVALGAEQPMRGMTWNTRRPSLILGDDLEDDEQVMSLERREKMRNWFMRTLLPIGTMDTKFRIVGTILHVKSLLKGLIESDGWTSKVYEACNETMDEDSILWPEQFTRRRLENIKQHYAEMGNLIGFNMEYRNIAVDTTSGYFIPSDFIPMENTDFSKHHVFYVGGDLAISTAKRRDHTAFEIGGVDSEGFLDIMEVRRGRWDGGRIIEEMFSIHDSYEPEQWFVESGSILKGLMPALEIAYRQKGIFLPIVPMVPVADKMTRARPIQARMRARGVRFNTEASWFPEYENELIQFRGGDEPNDQADAHAWLGQGLARMVNAPTEKEYEEDARRQIRRAREEQTMRFGLGGRSSVTGY